jgi:urease accessory protein
MKLPRILAISALSACIGAVALRAEAHTGALAGVASGAAFLHPFSGIDHLLVMIGVGLWAAALGGHARWLLPAGFLVTMSIGALLAHRIDIAGFEVCIAASVVVIGGLLAREVRIATAAGLAVCASVAFFHGYAHGAALLADGDIRVVVAFLSATALLHGTGALLHRQWAKQPEWSRRFGWGAALSGAALLVALG